MATETKSGVCNLCEAICGLEFTLTDGEVTAVRGNSADPLSRGHICPKGVALPDLHHDPDRLTRPLRKVRDPGGSDRWEEITWREAVSFVADNLARIQREHGRDAVGIYLGNPTVHSLAGMTHVPALVKIIGSRNVFSATSADQLPHQLLAHLLYGHQLMVPIPDIDRTDHFLVVGGNPMASNGSLMTVPDFPARARELRHRGGRMVVLDPRRTETAKIADEHHFVRPGSDAFVLLAMLQVILSEGATQLPAYVDGLDEIRAVVADFTPDLAAQHSGLDAAEIRRLALDFAAAPSAVAYGRMGISTQEFGTICQWAIHCLNLVTGNFDRPGGVMFTEPAVDIVGRDIAGRGHHGKYHSRVRGAPEMMSELPVSTMTEEITTPGAGQIKGFVTHAGNPVLSTPDGAALDNALGHLDFMVSIDFYLNETTRHADVILPPTQSLERDHYDLVFHALAVRNTARFTPALFEKGRDARHDWQIVRDLGLRLLRSSGGRWRQRAILAGRLSVSPTRTLDMLLRTGARKLSLKQLRDQPEGIDLGPLQPTMPARLKTSDNRINLAPAYVLADLDRLRACQLPRPEQLVLIGRRHQRNNNSWGHNTPRLVSGKQRHHLMMHPDDAARRGLADGAMVAVESAVGRVEIDVLLTDEVMPGVVSLPHGYGHGREGTRLGSANAVPGVSINDLTDPAVTDVSGNARLNGVPVTVHATQAS